MMMGLTMVHSRVAKLFHWGFTLVFLYALIKQLDEVEELEDFSLLQYEMVFATFFLVLLVVRFVYMRFTQPTVLPKDAPQNIKVLAMLVHLGMYFCLSMIAVTGLMIGALYSSGEKTGNTMELVLLLHEIFVNTGYVLLILHIAAAIHHRRKADGIWDSMVPFWKEAPEK